MADASADTSRRGDPATLLAVDGLRIELQRRGHPPAPIARDVSLRVDQGEIVGLLGISRDITDRKEAEDLLREGEERLRSVLETSPDHVLMLDTDLRIRFANYASPGLTVQQLIGSPIYQYVEEEERASVTSIKVRVPPYNWALAMRWSP